MSYNIQPTSQPNKSFRSRNGSDELDVFEAARYFAGENFSGIHKNVMAEARNLNTSTEKYSMRPIGRRMSLDIPSQRGNTAMLIENPMMINKEKSKLPSSPGGKLAHFLNSLFNQKSSKKSKLKTKPKSTKDEDESLSGWRRKRRSSISHFSSGNSNSTTTTTTSASATIMSDSKSPFSTSTSSGFRTPPYHIAHTPTKTTSYRDPRSFSDLKPHLTQIAKIPINGNLSKIENSNIKSDLSEKRLSFGNGLVEKVKLFDHKQDEYHHHKGVSREDIKELTRFIDDQDDGDSDSSSDLFELTNCDLGYFSSGLPVYGTTHMDSIKRGAPISS